jgi:hypothetical protein
MSMKTYLPASSIVAAGLLVVIVVLSSRGGGTGIAPETALAAKFEDLSKNGNSPCSAEFTDSIAQMTDGMQIKGS